MSGKTDLVRLIRAMKPELSNQKYVFCTVNSTMAAAVKMEPWAIITEDEGITVIIEIEKADKGHFVYDSVYRRITLHVHSSLNAVGLTATVSAELTKTGISANVIAGYYHDHIFVQAEQAGEALSCLQNLSKKYFSS